MKDLRTRWAALVAALLLLLCAAGVAGAAHVILPATAAPQAQEQVAKDHEDEDIDEDEDQDEDSTTEDTTEDVQTDAVAPAADGAQGEHGALVSAVAQNKECVGGLHDNHGWAVSQVARGLLVPEADGCPLWVPLTVTTTTDTTETTDVAAAPGKSGEHRKDKDKKAKTHGRWASQP
ncbi:MAG: hypothetical protein ABWY52_00470 [Candidatus Limnocylindrales bacterium]